MWAIEHVTWANEHVTRGRGRQPLTFVDPNVTAVWDDAGGEPQLTLELGKWGYLRAIFKQREDEHLAHQAAVCPRKNGERWEAEIPLSEVVSTAPPLVVRVAAEWVQQLTIDDVKAIGEPVPEWHLRPSLGSRNDIYATRAQ